jgi:uncharacterized protein with FMN-binding domain
MNRVPLGMAIVLMLIASSVHAATIEFLSGNKLDCKVLKKDDATVTVEVVAGGEAKQRTINLSLIHAVVINGKRHIINEKPGGAASSSASSPAAKASGAASDSASPRSQRSKAEIDALIDQVGREPPDWFESTPLAYPPTLDLQWPEPAPGGWDNQRNVGQYIWDVINPNPNKWREGVRLMHHLLTLHKDDPKLRTRVMMELGRMYHDLHEDYARAAFWWRQAGVEKNASTSRQAPLLAHCYQQLGNKQMALALLGKGPITLQTVKRYGELGDQKKATQLAERFAADNGRDLAYIAVADGYRSAGKAKEALTYYQKALDLAGAPGAKGRVEQTKNRARASIEAIKLFDLADPAKVADGAYSGESLGYEGPIKVAVTVSGGKIESVRVTEHREKQFYSALTDTPAKIIAKQGVKGVDATSNATITSEAIINGTAKALASGAR